MTESNVQPFEFRGNPVATVTAENGTVLFCAKHVATALGYSNTNDAIRKHCRHIDGVANRYPITDSLGRTQQAVFLTEGDVYRLIASSKLPSAVEFEHWLFDEVVPQIRRTGGYIPPGRNPGGDDGARGAHRPEDHRRTTEVVGRAEAEGVVRGRCGHEQEEHFDRRIGEDPQTERREDRPEPVVQTIT